MKGFDEKGHEKGPIILVKEILMSIRKEENFLEIKVRRKEICKGTTRNKRTKGSNEKVI